MDLTYFKKILDDTRTRIDELSFLEQRATMGLSGTSLEGTYLLHIILIDEIALVYDEIKKNEKELKNLL